jgi:hypothetical protein
MVRKTCGGIHSSGAGSAETSKCKQVSAQRVEAPKLMVTTNPEQDRAIGGRDVPANTGANLPLILQPIEAAMLTVTAEVKVDSWRPKPTTQAFTYYWGGGGNGVAIRSSAVSALANKLARIIWAVWHRDVDFSVTTPAAA